MSDLIELGRFGRPHGVKGALRIWLHNEQSPLLKKGRTLQVGSRPDDVRALELVEVRHDAQGTVVRFDGIADREAASSLNGMLWFEPRSAFPATQDGEYYHIDLIGLEVRLETGALLGTVTDVLSLPASEMLLVQGEIEIMIPFVDTFLVGVDLPGRTIHVRDVGDLVEAQRLPTAPEGTRRR